jgi:hypothetical protein
MRQRLSIRERFKRDHVRLALLVVALQLRGRKCPRDIKLDPGKATLIRINPYRQVCQLTIKSLRDARRARGAIATIKWSPHGNRGF